MCAPENNSAAAEIELARSCLLTPIEYAGLDLNDPQELLRYACDTLKHADEHLKAALKLVR